MSNDKPVSADQPKSGGTPGYEAMLPWIYVATGGFIDKYDVCPACRCSMLYRVREDKTPVAMFCGTCTCERWLIETRVGEAPPAADESEPCPACKSVGRLCYGKTPWDREPVSQPPVSNSDEAPYMHACDQCNQAHWNRQPVGKELHGSGCICAECDYEFDDLAKPLRDWPGPAYAAGVWLEHARYLLSKVAQAREEGRKAGLEEAAREVERCGFNDRVTALTESAEAIRALSTKPKGERG
jgi:hypothetical protein